MMERITGKVVDVKNLFTVVINKGSEDGVEEDMRFVIYELGEELFDPETGVQLGKMEYVKTKVKVSHVSDKYSIAETYETYTPVTFSALFGGATGATGPRQERMTLPLSDEMRSKFLEGKRSLEVKIGDLIKQI
jgi:hypothetical protein